MANRCAAAGRRFATVREFADATRDAVLAGAWDQSVGHTSPHTPHRPCCIGTKLAIALGEPRGTGPRRFRSYDWLDGIAHAARALGAPPQVLAKLLWVCGAPHRPFDNQAWSTDRAWVWDRLRAIETLPQFPVIVDGRRADGRIASVNHVRDANRDHWLAVRGVDVAAWPRALDIDAFWQRFGL